MKKKRRDEKKRDAMNRVSTVSGGRHGTTIRYSNQLSYNRHVWCLKKTRQKYTFFEYLQQVPKLFLFAVLYKIIR